MGTLSRTCKIPSPSQRPRVPPRDAKNLEKLKVGKSLIVVSTLLSKAMSILDIFLLLEVLYISSIKTVFMSEFYKTSIKLNVSRIDIAFNNKVDTTIRDFPTFNFSSFLASLGGSLGLWLGLGILQVLDSVPITICKNIRCWRKKISA